MMIQNLKTSSQAPSNMVGEIHIHSRSKDFQCEATISAIIILYIVICLCFIFVSVVVVRCSLLVVKEIGTQKCFTADTNSIGIICYILKRSSDKIATKVIFFRKKNFHTDFISIGMQIIFIHLYFIFFM